MAIRCQWRTSVAASLRHQDEPVVESIPRHPQMPVRQAAATVRRVLARHPRRHSDRPLPARKAASLPPPPREANGYSAHGSAHLERLAFIGHCWALDMPLADVKRFSSSWRRPTRIAGAIFLARVRARLASMGALETQLSALGARCAANRRNPPLRAARGSRQRPRRAVEAVATA
jgi:DNA-binding transcriptional MerR regulator